MVAAGQLSLDLQHGTEIALNGGGSATRQLEQIGIPLLGHDAGAGRECSRETQVPELLGAEHDDVLRQARELVTQLAAPEQHSRFKLATAALHRRDVPIQSAEAERTGHQLSPKWQRHSVPGGTPERRAVHLKPQLGERLDRIQHTLCQGAGPESDRRRHCPAGVGVAGPEHGSMRRCEKNQSVGDLQSSTLESEQLVLQVEPDITGDLIVPRPAGVQSLSDAGVLDGEPLFHRGVDVLVPPVQFELAVGNCTQAHA